MTPVVLLLALLTACQSSPEWVHAYGARHPLAGSIHDTAQNRPVGEKELLARVAEADFVLIGESRDNLDHRRLEALLIAAAGRRPLAAAAFEVIETDQQPVLVEHRHDDLAALGRALHLEGGDAPLDTYGAVLAVARRTGAELVAAGLPGSSVAAVMAGGTSALPAAFVVRTGLDRPLPPLLAAALERTIAAAYCGELGQDLLTRLAGVERARDAGLADRLAAVAGRNRGVLIADRARVRKDWGAPWYLERLRPGARTVSIALLEVEHVREMPTIGVLYDYVWFTPGAHPPGSDGCRQPGGAAGEIEVRRIAPMRPRHLS
ncbi:ChaN family lipoprotein [Benzoatithermus flavus]|uniref:ChaN family lipoprotein n=1 Tax=Benzoatithermus flavus TaxID=3108223 RepID=A0ABU8XV77_9PROT